MQSLELLFENLEEADEIDYESAANGNDFDFTNDVVVKSTGIYRHYPTTLSLKTERTGSPATLTGELVDITEHIPRMGATVRLKVDGIMVFIGRVFQTSVDKYGVMSFTAYDVLRYLKNTFSNYYPRTYKVSDVITDIAIANNLSVGKLVEAPTQGRSLLCENESGIDIISKLVEVGTILSGRILVFYANGEDLTLSYADEMIADVLVGDNSLATEYSLTTSIDDDTYNQVLLYRESEHVGWRHYATKDDPASVKKWGVLRLTESVEGLMSNEQLNDRAAKMLQMKNRALKTMTITALGVVGLRAGMMINIHFPSIPDEISRKQTVILDSVTHNFEDGNHTMTLEVHTFWRDI
jgi:hypothetical protein